MAPAWGIRGCRERGGSVGCCSPLPVVKARVRVRINHRAQLIKTVNYVL